MCHVFHFMFYVIHFAILDLCKINCRGAYRFFPNLCKQFQLERALTEKLKFKHLDGVFKIFKILWFLKTRGVVFMKINLIL